MKFGISLLISSLAFNSVAFALVGTSSGGGVLVPERSVSCHDDDGKGSTIDLKIERDPSTNDYLAFVQLTSLSGLHAPILFSNLTRTQPSDEVISYHGSGINLEINLVTGLASVPPHYDSRLLAAGVAETQTVQLVCVLVH